MKYEYDPLPIDVQQRLRQFFVGNDALKMRECMVALMNSHMIDSMNHRMRAHGLDKDKFSALSDGDHEKAQRIQTFLNVLDEIASPQYIFRKIKITD